MEEGPEARLEQSLHLITVIDSEGHRTAAAGASGKRTSFFLADANCCRPPHSPVSESPPGIGEKEEQVERESVF